MAFLQARHFTPTSGRTIKHLVIHTMEAPESGNTAESVANYFRTVSRPASAHWCIDNNSEVRCVLDKDVAYAAPGANATGIQYELAGTAGQNAAQWGDAYSQGVLRRAAALVAADAKRYGIPVRRLTVAQLGAGERGIIGHTDATRAFRKSTHTDPGAAFPWSQFLDLVRGTVSPGPTSTEKPAPRPAPVPAPAFPLPGGSYFGPRSGPVSSVSGYYSHREDLKRFQLRMRARGWNIAHDGLYGPETAATVRKFQKEKGLAADALIGPATWKAAFEAPVTQ